MSIEAYPLHWPPHRPRTTAAQRKRAAFHSSSREMRHWADGSSYTFRSKQALSLYVASKRLLSEIRAFTPIRKAWVINPETVIVSSNVPVRQDGMPYSNRREPDDPGVAVYFQMNGQQHCLTCDKWDRVADNLGAISKHIEAMRGQLRWGVADVAAMFAGFKALPGAIVTPALLTPEEAADFIRKWGGYAKPLTQKSDFIDGYRAAAKKLHPDTNGGAHLNDWNLLQEAKRVLDQHHGVL